jgi:DNA (cytosine-5)-methyltransferase 1
LTPIRYLDVCSGYSAITLAWEGLPFKCVGYSEIEPFPRAILEQRHHAVAVDWDHRFAPGSNVTPLFGDFTQIEDHHVGPVDLLAGGTPCQAFSVAGKRLGLDDPRGNLTLEFLALARRVRAGWLAWENVPGFLSHDGGRTMGTFLGFLGELGYGFAWRVLDAQYIRVDRLARAVPQRRKRLFVVAHLGDQAGPAAVLFERESLRGDPAPRRETGEGTAPTLSARTRGGGGLGTDFDCDGGLIADTVATIDASYGRLQGCSGQDANHGHSHLVAFGGNDTRGPIDVATARSAHGGPHGRLDFDSETFITQQVAATLTKGGERKAGAGYSGRRDEDDKNLVAHAFDARQSDVCQYGDRSPPLDTDGYTIGVAHALRAEGFDASEDGKGRGTPIIPIDMRQAGRGEKMTNNRRAGSSGGAPGMGVGEDGDPSPSLSTSHPPAVAFSVSQNSNGFAWEGDVAPTLQGRTQSAADNQFDGIRQGWQVRRLTPTECERLMGVPDGFTAITYRGKPAADGPRYKALGNSQAVNCMRWIGRGLADVIAAQRAAEPAA